MAVGTGFVASLARPGGNITGLTTQATDLAGKRVELLKEVVPKLSRAAILWDPSEPGREALAKGTEAAAQTLGLKIRSVATRNLKELESSFAAIAREGGGAVIVVPSSVLGGHRGQIAELAANRRLPTMCLAPEYVEAGCLMSYSTNIADLHRLFCRQDPQRFEAGRSSCGTADEIRAGDQPEDGEGTWPQGTSVTTAACGPNDRVAHSACAAGSAVSRRQGLPAVSPQKRRENRCAGRGRLSPFELTNAKAKNRRSRRPRRESACPADTRCRGMARPVPGSAVSRSTRP